MVRSPLLCAARNALRVAELPLRPGAPPVDELVEMNGAAMQKRRVNEETPVHEPGSLVSKSGKPDSTQTGFPKIRPRRPGDPKIVIVGAGLAGLTAAYELRKKGVFAEIHEASDRVGGRLLTAPNAIGPGLTVDLGAEFVDRQDYPLR